MAVCNNQRPILHSPLHTKESKAPSSTAPCAICRKCMSAFHNYFILRVVNNFQQDVQDLTARLSTIATPTQEDHQQALIKRTMEATKMNSKYSQECLAQNSWSFERAYSNFQTLMVQLRLSFFFSFLPFLFLKLTILQAENKIPPEFFVN
jgi:hypothetical protein